METTKYFQNLFAKQKTKRSFGWDLFQVSLSVLLAVLAFIVTNIWAQTLSEKAEQIGVIVASRDLAAPKILNANDITIQTFRKDSLPKSVIPESKLRELMGVTLVHTLSQGEMLTTNSVAGKVDPDLGGFYVPRNAKGFSIPASWLTTPFPKVKKGDTVTIAYGFSKEEKSTSGIVAQGVPVVSVEKGDGGQIISVLLVLDDKLALNLVQLRASNYQLAVVVDGIAPESTIFKK